MAAVLSVGTLTGCAARNDTEAVLMDGRLGGRPIGSGTAENPITLRSNEVTELTLEIENVSTEPVTVAHVRLEGELLDLIFLTYDTGIHETIAPGERRTVAFPIDFFDLDGQVHGFLRAKLRLYDDDRVALGSRSLVVDGRGEPLATTSTFNLVLLAVALASFAWNLIRLAQRRLPAHRFARGLRFLHSGLAMGLALATAASTLRIWPLATTGWVLVTTVVALFGFVLGYLSPGSDEPIIDLTGPDGADRVGADGAGSVESEPWTDPSTFASSSAAATSPPET